MYLHILVIMKMIEFAFGDEKLPQDVTEMVGKLSREVVLRYFKESKCLAVITENDNVILDYIHPLDLQTFHIQISLSHMKASKRTEAEYETYTWDSVFLAPMNAGCLNFVIQTSDVKYMVENFARLAHSPKSVYRANRKYFYIPSKQISDDYFYVSVKETFSIKQINYMPDIVIVKFKSDLDFGNARRTLQPDYTKDKLTLELITHRFVGDNPSEIVYLDTWSASIGFSKDADLYPDKVSNLMGKRIPISTMDYPPLAVIDTDANPPIYDGLELLFIHEWSRWINFTWYIVYDDGWWGEVWANGSGDGICGVVSSDLADVGFSAIYLWDNVHLFTDFSAIYFGSSLTVVAPRPKPMPGWMVPIHPFAPNMWFAVITSVIICSIILYVTSKASMNILGTGLKNNVVNMYSTLVECSFRTMGLLVLQIPPDERDYSTPRHVPMRHLVTWVILFYFVLTTAYCGGLAMVLTLPNVNMRRNHASHGCYCLPLPDPGRLKEDFTFQETDPRTWQTSVLIETRQVFGRMPFGHTRYEPPIESVNDMADHDLVWGGTDDAFIFIMKGSSDPKIQTVVKNFRCENEEYLAERAKEGEWGFVIERMMGGHFYLPSFVNEDTMKHLRVMKGDLYFSHTVYISRKGSPISKSMNKMIQWVRDAGLFVFWEAMTVRKYMSTTRQLSVINSRDIGDLGPTKLLLRHISGAFYMLGFGLAIGFVFFILEFVRFKCHKIFEEKLKRKKPALPMITNYTG